MKYFSGPNSTYEELNQLRHSYPTINPGQQDDGYEQPLTNRDDIENEYAYVEETWPRTVGGYEWWRKQSIDI